MRAAAGSAVNIQGHFVPEAQAALMAGNQARHDCLIAAAVAAITDADVIALAQAPMASATALISEAPGRRVVTTPVSAARHLRQLLSGRA